MAVRAYLDSSGKHKDRYVTLAAFTANDDTWAEFECGWNKILKEGFRPLDFMHMAKAVHLASGTPFSHIKGWTREEMWKIIIRLADFISQFKGGLLTAHTCEVHMNQWRWLTNRGHILHSEIEICNCYVCEIILLMFAKRQIEFRPLSCALTNDNDLLNFVFDQDEPFIHAFRELRNLQNEITERTGRASPWKFVDGITDGNHRKTPGLQAADMLAWAVNRENTVGEGREGKYLATVLRQVVENTSLVANRNFLRTHQLPHW